MGCGSDKAERPKLRWGESRPSWDFVHAVTTCTCVSDLLKSRVGGGFLSSV